MSRVGTGAPFALSRLEAQANVSCGQASSTPIVASCKPRSRHAARRWPTRSLVALMVTAPHPHSAKN